MDRVEENLAEDDLSFAPALDEISKEEARRRLEALRGVPLGAEPSRLAVVSEPVPEDAPAPAATGSREKLAIELMRRLLDTLDGGNALEAPVRLPSRQDEEEEPAEAQKAVKEPAPFFRPMKERLTMRVDADVLAAFKATGKGWQSKINDVLRENMPKG
jgi:uncharacterized protein (DUF4415 family)